MVKPQSKGLKVLYAELGFGVGQRDVKVFRTSLDDFREKHEISNHTNKSFSKLDSAEAKTIALDFCNENDQGRALWPPTTPPEEVWSWSLDRPKILENLAAIIVQLAINSMKQKSKAGRTDQDAEDEGRLSPQSMIYSLPPPPTGTSTRPGKHPISVGKQIEIENARIRDESLDEIESLDPKKEDKIIKQFTSQWLDKANDIARWPSSADIRLKTLMHENNLYDEQDVDFNILKFAGPLRAGTDIAKTNPIHFCIFERRIRERMAFHADKLREKGLIEIVDHTMQKHPEFSKLWKQRQSHWSRLEAETQTSQVVEGAVDVYDIANLPEDPNSIPQRQVEVSRENEMPPPPRPSIFTSPIKKTSTSTGVKITNRRKADGSIERESIANPQKRQRIDAGRPSQITETCQSMDLPVVAGEVDSESGTTNIQESRPVSGESSSRLNNDKPPAVHIPCVQSFSEQDMQDVIQEHNGLLSDTEDEAPQAVIEAEVNPPIPSITSRLRQLTPTIPMTSHVGTDPPNDLYQILELHSQDSVSPSPKIEVTSPLARPPRLSPFRDHRRSTPISPQPSRQRLQLFSQDVYGNWNVDNDRSISIGQLKTLDVAEFFGLYSQRGNIPPEDLTCLTFEFVFAEGVEVVLRAGDEAGWDNLRDLADMLFNKFKRRNPGMVKFKMSIEAGDTSRASRNDAGNNGEL